MTDRKTYSRDEISSFAAKLNMKIHFQFNVSNNNSRVFGVGYMFKDWQKHLFCKSPNSYPSFEKAQEVEPEETYYLCNEFQSLKI